MSVCSYMASVGEMSSTARRSHRLRVIHREAVGHAAAAVVAGEAEALEAQARA